MLPHVFKGVIRLTFRKLGMFQKRLNLHFPPRI